MPEVHGTQPHEILETAAGEHGPDRRERALELVAVVMLATATLAAAWSGYQAARWDGKESVQFARAAALDVEAARANTRANQELLTDSTLFNEWLAAHSANNADLMSQVEGRFRDEYRAAFDAWLALDPFGNPSAPPEPARMPEYILAEAHQADDLAVEAEHALDDGEHAKDIGDQFILNTVFLASALFLAGISSRFDWRSARIVILLIAAGALGFALLTVLQLPVA